MQRALTLLSILALAVAIALPLAAQAQVAPAKQAVPAVAKPKELPPLLTPRMAVELAHDDAAPIGLFDGAHQFYVYAVEPSDLVWDAVAYAVNTALSHSVNLYRPVRVADGKLLRIDKRELCPNPKDRARLDHLLENVLAFAEPFTHRSDLHRDAKGIISVKVKVPPYKANDGRVYRYKLEAIRKEEQFAAHVGIDKMLGLYSLLGETNLPIVRADWLVCMILSTQKVGRSDGIYYEALGWQAGKTTQDDVLRELGAGEDQIEEQRLTLVQQIVKARREIFDGTSRACIFRSGVASAGERRVDAFTGTKIRPAAGVGIIFLTHDLDRKTVDPAQSPIQNMVLFADDGREGLGLRTNGMQAGWASDGKGLLVESVPEGIAHDSTIPHPSPQTLEPIISCLACHGVADGYLPYNNDLLALSRERIPTDDPTKFDQVNVFDDDALVLAGFSLEETLEILRGLFGHDPDSAILLAQQQHGRACFELTGRKTGEVTGEIVRMRNYYVFGMVTTDQALTEIGVRFVEPDYGPDAPAVGDDSETAERKARSRAIKRNERLKEVFHEHVPPLAKVAGKAAEHPMINVLRGGRFSITRAQWENIFADVMGRLEAARVRKDQS